MQAEPARVTSRGHTSLTYLRQWRTVAAIQGVTATHGMTIDHQAFEALLKTVRILRRKRRERVARLLGLGKSVARSGLTDDIEVRAIRRLTGLSQARFAEMLDIDLSTVRNWEQGRRQPTGPARALLRAIRNNPLEVIKALSG